MQRMKLNPYLMPYKNKLRIDHTPTHRSYKTLGKNISVNLHDPGSGKTFSDMILKAQATKNK